MTMVGSMKSMRSVPFQIVNEISYPLPSLLSEPQASNPLTQQHMPTILRMYSLTNDFHIQPRPTQKTRHLSTNQKSLHLSLFLDLELRRSVLVGGVLGVHFGVGLHDGGDEEFVAVSGDGAYTSSGGEGRKGRRGRQVVRA